jgi:hypothetical protein
MQDVTRRYDIFSFTHKALRAYLSHVLLDVGRTDWRDAEDRTLMISAVRELLGVCHTHLEQENTFIHPAMEARKPGCTRFIVDEHVGQLFAIDVLFDLVDAVESAAIPDTAAAGQRLYRELAVFVAENFEHMAFEESEHNRVLWQFYTDAEIMDIERRIAASVPPERTLILLTWMLPHLNPAERAEMMGNLRTVTPADSFQRVLGMLRGQLPTKDWGKLTTALGTV